MHASALILKAMTKGAGRWQAGVLWAHSNASNPVFNLRRSARCGENAHATRWQKLQLELCQIPQPDPEKSLFLSLSWGPFHFQICFIVLRLCLPPSPWSLGERREKDLLMNDCWLIHQGPWHPPWWAGARISAGGDATQHCPSILAGWYCRPPFPLKFCWFDILFPPKLLLYFSAFPDSIVPCY